MTPSPDSPEDHKKACELERKILETVDGNVDYIAMAAMTYALATLIVQLPAKKFTVSEQLDLFDSQLRMAVGLLLQHKKNLGRMLRPKYDA